MCGINGFIWDDTGLIRKMNEKIAHRSPDDRGIYVDKSVSLGNVRLAIIDISERGHQPMKNENGDVWIIYNGELYNFLALREELQRRGHDFSSDSDTEVVLHAYEEYGFDCLEKFNGMYAFCIYDTKKKLLFLARDRVGKKPLYYYWDGKKFIFSSEIKGILEHEVERKVDETQLYHYLSFICSTREKTLFENIYKIPSGNYMVFDLKNKKFYLKEYWSIDKITIDYSISEREALKRLEELITSSVVIRRMSDVPQGVFLSGGIDSSSLVAINSEFSDSPINTFSIYFEGAGKNFDETYYARKVAEMFETNHKEIELNHEMLLKFLPKLIYQQDEPISDPVCIPIAFLAKETKRNKVTMIHLGEGADELFVGYKSYLDFINANKVFNLYTKFPWFVKDFFKDVSEINNSNVYTMFLKDRLKLMAEDKNLPMKNMMGFFESEKYVLLNNGHNLNSYKYIESLLQNTHDTNYTNEYLQKMRVLEYKLRLPELLLMRVDKFSMMYSVEARAPFMDYRLIEYSMKINPKLHYSGGEKKYLFKKVLKDKLPKEIIYRKKVGFGVPLSKEEFLDPLVDIVKRELNSKDMKKFFKSEYINKIINLYKAKKRGYEFRMWVLLNFALWHKFWIRGDQSI